MTDFNQILSAGMSALLSQSDTRAAIVEYIKALTDKEKPKEQWREVYWMQSDEIRLSPKDDLISGIKNPKTRLLVRAYWDQYGGVGRVNASMTSERKFRKNAWYGDDIVFDNHLLATEVIDAKDYMDVINFAVAWWDKAYQVWSEKTALTGETGEK